LIAPARESLHQIFLQQEEDRSGLATASRLAGKDQKVIAANGRLAENSATMLGYMQIADRFKDNAARGPGCDRRN
jgi:hypothetical protein